LYPKSCSDTGQDIATKINTDNTNICDVPGKRFGTQNFDLICFVTFFNVLSLKTDINEPFYKQKKLESHYGSVIQCNRTADPDPDLNVTDPEQGMFGLIWSSEVNI
jgi:hypothetical protein